MSPTASSPYPSPAKRFGSLAGALLIGLLLAACGSSGGNLAANSHNSAHGHGGSSDPALCGSTAGSGSVTVGYADFAENQALAAIYAAALDKCGYSATTRGFKSREIYYPALTKNQIQVVPDYAATLTDFINQAKNGANAPSKA